MAGRNSTRKESRSCKAQIVKLKKQGKMGKDIARELRVSKQYISQVLIQAGLAYGMRSSAPRKPEGFRTEVVSTIARLERQGEPVLAERLSGILNRYPELRRRQGGRDSGV